MTTVASRERPPVADAPGSAGPLLMLPSIEPFCWLSWKRCGKSLLMAREWIGFGAIHRNQRGQEPGPAHSRSLHDNQLSVSRMPAAFPCPGSVCRPAVELPEMLDQLPDSAA